MRRSRAPVMVKSGFATLYPTYGLLIAYNWGSWGRGLRLDADRQQEFVAVHRASVKGHPLLRSWNA